MNNNSEYYNEDVPTDSPISEDTIGKLQTIIDSLTPEEQSQLCDMIQAAQDEKDNQRDVMKEADDAGEGEGRGYF